MIDDGTEYAERALVVAIQANAEFVEPIRLALLAVSEERNARWRAYTLGLRGLEAAERTAPAVPKVAPSATGGTP